MNSSNLEKSFSFDPNNNPKYVEYLNFQKKYIKELFEKKNNNRNDIPFNEDQSTLETEKLTEEIEEDNEEEDNFSSEYSDSEENSNVYYNNVNNSNNNSKNYYN